MSNAAKRIALGLLISTAAGMLTLHWMMGREAASRAGERADERAMALAKSAAASVGTLPVWIKSHPEVEAYRVVNIDDRTIEASTFPEDAKEGASPRRMVRSEKPLYDLAQQFRNEDEKANAQSAGGRMLAAAVTAHGMVQIRVAPVAAGVRPHWSRVLLFILAPVVLFVAIAWPLGKHDRVLLVVASLLLLGAMFLYQRDEWPMAILPLALLIFIGAGGASWTGRTLKRYHQAYFYVAPAMVGMILLVFFPFFYGIALSFTSQTVYTSNKPLTEIWNGVQNYKDILGDIHVTKETPRGRSIDYQNFYWTLGFTIAWTITNVAIGVTVGLFLALILNTKTLRFKPAYRVLLILPWAVPNYITALIWAGMFHQQFGVINQFIQIFGGSPVSWFDKPYTSFAAVVATNGWLSFPFMMVVSLGALQSIPNELYEAARVDGATRWQQFRSITLPSLKPALIPAIILSVVWTFNMFNIIYLVSAGEPAGSTEILITKAYKIAFEQYRYGYAAAYSTVIFAILLIYGVFQNRVTRATESIA
ncbi:MAG TPA: sugar ABC transporter permease [Thermoanaerobaculia bacterium]|nr:sugar ABC transporter permease [Thermoanaerobaculia bacterium]